jgi:hypothetical protein
LPVKDTRSRKLNVITGIEEAIGMRLFQDDVKPWLAFYEGSRIDQMQWPPAF